MIVISDARWAAYRKAMDELLIGGNHVVGLLPANHPDYHAQPHEALAIMGYGQWFDAWCAWRGIMLQRDAWDALLAIADPPPSGGAAKTIHD